MNANLTDIELKDHGNKLFAARKFDDAISCYSKAIVSFTFSLNPLQRHEGRESENFQSPAMLKNNKVKKESCFRQSHPPRYLIG